MKKIFAFSLVLLFAASSFAQIKIFSYPFTISYEAGYTNQLRSGSQFSDVYLNGLRSALLGKLEFNNKISIQTGAIYNLNFYTQTQKFNNASSIIRLSYGGHQLDVPVYVGYHFNMFNHSLKVFGYTGPAVRFGISEKRLVEFVNTTELIENQAGIASGLSNLYKDKELKRVSLALGVGGGFEWKNFFLKSGYDFGLTDINRLKNKSSLHQSGWFLTLGHNF
ncbi:MAG: PorT family protein [Prevotellaceae bacterium]|jgi:hypothetical protein|nr:PorT family protein [Prevotellaceae bacterium]